MSGTALERPDVDAYLAAVRAELADLPLDERDDLLADVETSLLDSGEPPRLPPAEFAAELREAAGFGRTLPTQGRSRSVDDAVRAWLASDRAAALAGTARELAPVWWLARAYVAVALVALAAGWGWPVGSGTTSSTFSVETSLLVLGAAAAVSLWLGVRGRRRDSRYRRLSLVANVVLAVALVPIAAHSFDRLQQRAAAPPEIVFEPLPGLAYDGVQIRNVYPYARDGRPLFDVLLFDENGRPLDILSGPEDTSRRVLTAADGSRLFNSFPIRYFEPGTATVARPELGPPVSVPEIVTPELEQPGR